MRKLFLLTCIILSSCNNGNLEYIGQEIVDGKVSATEEGHGGGYGLPAEFPKIWVQNATTTRKIEVPFKYEGRWKVGDSCLLIIEKYKQKSQNK